MARTGVGRSCGRGGRSGIQHGRGRDREGRKRTVQRATSPSNDAQYIPSASGQVNEQAKKKYRSFGEDDARFRGTLIDQAAKARIEATKNNAKNPGKMPHGFATKQINQLAISYPGLNIKEYDVYNRVKAVQNKEEAKRKKRRQADAERSNA